MEFEVETIIHRPLESVFAFFRDIEKHAGREGSVVPSYEEITPGPVGVGAPVTERSSDRCPS